MTRRQVLPDALRHWLFGLVAAVVASTVLGTGAVDAYGLHRCPHHDGLPDAVGAAVAHDEHGRSAHEGDTPADAHGDHGPCTCVGLCGVTSAALPVPRSVVVVPGHVSFRTATAVAPQEHAPLHFAYLLPFANAPPSMS